MPFSSAHQAHAARCRHAAALNERDSFRTALDRQFETFASQTCLPPGAYPPSAVRRFAASRRARLVRQMGQAGFRLSTYQTWLRQWVRDRLSRVTADSCANDNKHH